MRCEGKKVSGPACYAPTSPSSSGASCIPSSSQPTAAPGLPAAPEPGLRGSTPSAAPRVAASAAPVAAPSQSLSDGAFLLRCSNCSLKTPAWHLGSSAKNSDFCVPPPAHSTVALRVCWERCKVPRDAQLRKIPFFFLPTSPPGWRMRSCCGAVRAAEHHRHAGSPWALR